MLIVSLHESGAVHGQSAAPEGHLAAANLVKNDPRTRLTPPIRHSGSIWRAVLSAVAPSWRLFDNIAALPVLQLRSMDPLNPSAPWLTVPTMAPGHRQRSPWRLLHNPDETMRLASCGLVDRLAAEVNDGDVHNDEGIDRSVTFQLVERLVQREACVLGCRGPVEFRIVLSGGDVDGTSADILMLQAPARSTP